MINSFFFQIVRESFRVTDTFREVQRAEDKRGAGKQPRIDRTREQCHEHLGRRYKRTRQLGRAAGIPTSSWSVPQKDTGFQSRIFLGENST